jgi:ATP-dependent Lhr-like helicase
MIESMEKPWPDSQTLNVLHPLVRKWFTSKFKSFSPPQKYSIVNVHSRINTLISSPTGSGKTLSAFLAIINDLIDLSEKGLLEDRIYCTYISPLKALANDIQRNLLEPLKELQEMAGRDLGIRIAIRSGDTTNYEKQKMAKNPPHILITTPESFSIMLTSPKFSKNFERMDWCIIDEIHALASSKRGTHLSVALERLHEKNYFCRIGLSATVAPLNEVAKYLVGFEGEEPRDCKVVDVSYAKELDLKVISPVKNLMTARYEEINTETYKLMDKLIQEHRTTIIFTNTRSATERVVHHLKERFPKNYTRIDKIKEDLEEDIDSDKYSSLIGAHHSSLSRQHRLKVEEKLKKGELKCVVSSTSLELGIDIGYVDLVILLGSPKSVARALQRVGRSGHKLHEKAKGRIIVMDRDDLIECSVLLKSAVEKKIDKIHIPKNCIDVLAQQVLSIALEENREVKDVFNLVKKSYSYNNLSRKDFDSVIDYLSGEFASLEDRYVYAKIWHDKETSMIGKKGKMTRVIYMTNVGTIPDETNIRVKVGKEIVGFISEPFLEKLKRGDVFVLGGNSYEFQYTRSLSAYVKAATGKKPTVPSWFSEMLPLSFDLAMEIQKFRRYMHQQLKYHGEKKQVLDFIDSYLYVDENAAESIYEYFNEQYSFSVIPHDRKILVEHISDEGKKTIVFHTLFGRRVNDVLSRSLAFAISKIHKQDVEMGINDNGFYLSTNKSVQATRAFSLIKSDDLYKLMSMALEKTEVLNRRFRHCAARSLMILRNYKGNSKSVGKQQRSSIILLSAIRKLGRDFPILKEAKREVLEDLMDILNAKIILEGIEAGEIRVEESFSEIPSPFSFNLMLIGFADIMKMEDRLDFLKRMHNMVLAKIELDKRTGK